MISLTNNFNKRKMLFWRHNKKKQQTKPSLTNKRNSRRSRYVGLLYVWGLCLKSFDYYWNHLISITNWCYVMNTDYQLSSNHAQSENSQTLLRLLRSTLLYSSCCLGEVGGQEHDVWEFSDNANIVITCYMRCTSNANDIVRRSNSVSCSLIILRLQQQLKSTMLCAVHVGLL